MCPLPLAAAVMTVEAEVVSSEAGATAVIVRRRQALENAFVKRRTYAFAIDVPCRMKCMNDN